MSRIRVYGEPSGAVKVVTFVADDPTSIAAEHNSIIAKGQIDPTAVFAEYADVSQAPTPTPTGFGSLLRNAFRFDGTKITLDLPTAQTIKLNQIRAQRVALFTAADAAYNIAVDTGNTVTAAAISAYRQQLRNLPQAAQPQLAALTDPVAIEMYQVVLPTPPPAVSAIPVSPAGVAQP